MRWEEEGEKDKCLAVITRQVRYDLYNTRAGDSCFTTEPTTYNTAYVVQYTISACDQALLLWGATKRESHNNTAREERRTSLLLDRLGVHVVARELEEEGCP